MTVTLADVGSGFKRTAINTNFDAIEAAINNDLLDKAGGKALEADLDYNSKRAINMAAGINNADGATVAQLNAAVGTLAPGDLVHVIERQLGSAAVSRVFTLASLVYTVGNNTLVGHRNGVLMDLIEDYTETSPTSVTLTFDPNGTDRFKFERWATV